MADGMTAMDGAQYAEGAYSQVVCRGGVWWHWRRVPVLGGFIEATGHDPQPTRRTVDIDATRARIALTLRRTVTQ